MTCGNCPILTEKMRLLSKEKLDFLSTPIFVKKKGSHSVSRHGKTDDQRKYHQAKVSLRKTKSNYFKSILGGDQEQDTYRESQNAIGWTEDACKHLDQVANEIGLTLPLRAKDKDTRTTGSWLSTRGDQCHRRSEGKITWMQ